MARHQQRRQGLGEGDDMSTLGDFCGTALGDFMGSALGDRGCGGVSVFCNCNSFRNAWPAFLIGPYRLVWGSCEMNRYVCWTKPWGWPGLELVYHFAGPRAGRWRITVTDPADGFGPPPYACTCHYHWVSSQVECGTSPVGLTFSFDGVAPCVASYSCEVPPRCTGQGSIVNPTVTLP